MPQGESNRKEIFELEQEKGEDNQPRMKHGNQSVFDPCSIRVSSVAFVRLEHSLFDSEQFNFKGQLRVRRNGVACAALTVAELGWNNQLTLAADFHAGDAFVPTLDDSPSAERELERLVAILAAVELRAVFEPAGVVHLDDLPRFGLVSGAFFQLHVLESRFGGNHFFFLLVFLIFVLRIGIAFTASQGQHQRRREKRIKALNWLQHK